MLEISFNDLNRQYLRLKNEIDKGISEVISSCSFISGSKVSELEEQLCNYTGAKHCITCANGTDALQIPLMAWGIGKGDAVFVPAFTFVATAEVVSLMGAVPVFCDVYEDSFNLDPESLRTEILKVKKEGRLIPKAVIAVDLFGQPAEYEKIQEICDEFSLKLIEDGAQGFGGEINGKKACTFGDVSATSFFPAKPLGCYGDGGAIFTDDDELADIFRSIRIHGKGREKYDNIRVGLNSRLDTIQAAVLIPKLNAFDSENQTRIKAAEHYTTRLSDKLDVPVLREGYTSSWAQYPLKASDENERSMYMEKLKSNNIPSMIYYPRPLHLQGAYSGLGYKKGSLPVSESLCRRVFSLPMHGYIDKEIIDRICDVLLFK